MNEQPWLFVYADDAATRARLLPLLAPGNRSWAERAPLLILLFTRRSFRRTGERNRHAAFDAGATWMSLALQARRLGLFAHAMGGFDAEASYAAAGVSAAEWEAMVAIAVGRKGPDDALPDALRQREQPTPRRPLVDVARRAPGGEAAPA
jgi:nitroreductase